MRSIRFVQEALACLLVLCGALALSPAAAPPPRPPAEILRLIHRLGDSEPNVRKQATKDLEARGEDALPALRAAWKGNTDVDIRLRAAVVISAIESKLYGEVRRFPGIVSVCVSPDGKTLATVGWNGSGGSLLRLWDIETGKNTLTLSGHTALITCLKYLPDGKHLLSGAHDKTLRLWDLRTGKEVRHMTGHTYLVYRLAISSDGKTAVSSGAGESEISVWNLGQGTLLRKLKGHTEAARGLAFVPGRQRCLSASLDGTIRLWDVSSGKELLKMPAGVKSSFVAIRPDGKQAVSGGADGILRFWDLGNGILLRKATGHTQEIRSVEYSDNGKRLLSTSLDRTVRLWDTRTGRSLQVLSGHTDHINEVGFLRDGKHAVSVSHDTTLRMWRLKP